MLNKVKVEDVFAGPAGPVVLVYSRVKFCFGFGFVFFPAQTLVFPTVGKHLSDKY